MTPEERAERVIMESWVGNESATVDPWASWTKNAIAEAIREAVAAEQEGLIAMIERAAKRWPDNPLVHATLMSLAAEIREARA